MFQLSEWCRVQGNDNFIKHQDVGGVWPELLLKMSADKMNKTTKSNFDEKNLQVQRNNFTIITSNLPVNNTVRFETDNKKEKHILNVSITYIFSFYSAIKFFQI